MHCKSLHTLPHFAATAQKIQVGNGQCISVLFIIPVIVEIHGYRFEIYTLVSKIHENVIKIIDGSTNSTLLIKLKFTCNKAVLDTKNVGKDTMILKLKEMIGIVDIRSLGYYKIKQGILQQNLSRYYRFEEAKKLCWYFNKFVDTLKRDREQTNSVDKYPWLDLEDERRNMMDREILEKFIDLRTSCLNTEEKLKVMDMFMNTRKQLVLGMR